MEDKFLKLTNAVYKVLEFFPESDPLKNRAKDKALVIMENLMEAVPLNGASLALLGRDIDMLLGYLWIGKSQGWLNSVNYLIIANQYEKIRNMAVPLGHSSEAMPTDEAVLELTQKLPGIEKSNTEKPEKKIEERVLNNKEPQDIPVQKEVAFTESPPYELSARQKQIIDFLNKNEKAQVMDLQMVLPDVTKRTIRRDLDELLNTGKIVRHGDFNQVFYKINESQILTS